jgi:hypothetical protein
MVHPHWRRTCRENEGGGEWFVAHPRNSTARIVGTAPGECSRIATGEETGGDAIAFEPAVTAALAIMAMSRQSSNRSRCVRRYGRMDMVRMGGLSAAHVDVRDSKSTDLEVDQLESACYPN